MTPLTAIRIDGQMYLKEENPFDPQSGHISQAEYNHFEATHPPIIALFKCEEGQSFVEGVDVRLGYAYRDNTKDPKGEYPGFAIDEDDIPSWCPYHKAFQLIEQKEMGNEPEEWIHPDEAAIGSLNDDLKTVTEQRDELLEALIEAQQQLAVIKSKLTNEKMLWSVNATIDKASVAINKALNKTK